MKQTGIAVLAFALWLGCRANPAQIHARIELDANLPATCVLLQVRGQNEQVLTQLQLSRSSGANELQVTVLAASDLPQAIALFARPMYGDGCQNLVPNGTSDEQHASFPTAGEAEVQLTLHVPPLSQDQDGDGYAGVAAGGPDCDDSNPAIHPGAPEQCMSGLDFDCDGHAGCNDPACQGQACVSPPAQLAFVTPPRQVLVGRCSQVVAVQTLDGQGQAVSVTGATGVNLSAAPAANFTFYSDSTCATPVDLVSIPTGASSARFYFMGTAAGTVTVSAMVSGIPGASQTETLNVGFPTRLVITTPAQTLAAGQCSGIVAVQSQDGSGTPANVGSSTSLNLSALGAGLTFYSDPGCTSPINSVTISASTNSGGFYFTDTSVGSVTLTVSASGLTSATQLETINSATANRLAFTTSPQTRTAGQCSGIVTVQSQDSANNPANVASNTPVTLSASGNAFSFYSDPGCTSSVGSVTISAGANSASFYFTGTQAGTRVITAWNAGLTGATQSEAINAAALSAIGFGTQPPAVVTGQCSPAVTVQTQDSYGNLVPVSSSTTVSLSATTLAGFNFYSNANCTTTTSSVFIPSGGTSASLYFSGTTGGSVTLTASATGLASGTQVENIGIMRQGTCTIPANQGLINCTITPAPLLDTTRAFIVFQATGADTSASAADVSCGIASAAQITCVRSTGSSNPVNITWFIPQFDSTSSVSVQRQLGSCPAGAVSSYTLTLGSPVTSTNDTFLLVSGKSGLSSEVSPAFRTATLTSTSTVDINTSLSCGTTGDAVDVQVVEFSGATVIRGNTGAMAGATMTVTVPSISSMGTAFLLYSYRSSSTDNFMCERAVRGEITNSTTLTFSRGNGSGNSNCTAAQIDDISWELVQLPAGNSVQQVSSRLSSGANNTSRSILTVDPTRSLVFAGGQFASGQVHGEGSYDVSTLPGEVRALHQLTGNGSSLQLTRDSANAGAKFTSYVIQFAP